MSLRMAAPWPSPTSSTTASTCTPSRPTRLSPKAVAAPWPTYRTSPSGERWRDGPVRAHPGRTGEAGDALNPQRRSVDVRPGRRLRLGGRERPVVVRPRRNGRHQATVVPHAAVGGLVLLGRV